MHQHQADGYLLVCSTQPSAAVVTRLEALERTKDIKAHVWDGVELERMLHQPARLSVAQRFMPYQRQRHWLAGTIATGSPNQFVGITRGYFIRMANRHGSTLPYQLDSAEPCLLRSWAKELGDGAVTYSDGQLTPLKSRCALSTDGATRTTVIITATTATFPVGSEGK